MTPALALATALAALIQLNGDTLSGGEVSGSARLPLERASGGDTPVLRFSSSAGPVRLLLDTGASSSMVTPALLHRLGLRSSALSADRFSIAGGGLACRRASPLRTRLPDLTLQGPGAGAASLRLSGAEALVLPVAGLPTGVDGVLGAPSLRRTALRIDPSQNTVSFGAEALRDLPADRRRLRLRWHRGVPLVRLLTPLGTIEALADTGAEGLFLAPSLARRLHPLSRAQAATLVGFCGAQTVQRQQFAAIRLIDSSTEERNPEQRPEQGSAGERFQIQRSDGLDLVKTGGGSNDRGTVEGIITDNPVFQQLGVTAIAGQEVLRQRVQLWRLDQAPPVLELWSSPGNVRP